MKYATPPVIDRFRKTLRKRACEFLLDICIFSLIFASINIEIINFVGSCSAQGSTSEDSRIADAAERQAWQDVTKLLEEDSLLVNTAQPDGMTALHWAASWGNTEITAKLIAKGAAVDSATRYQITPLSIACSNRNAKITKLLLVAGADANRAIAGGETPLMTAARSGDLLSVQALLEHGANLEAKDANGQTALMWCAAQGNVDVVDELIRSQADLNYAIESGFTAFLFAAREGHLQAALSLLDGGVDINQVMHPKNSKGRAPRNNMTGLQLAVESGHFELALKLVDRGADPNDQRSGFTPLHAIVFTRKSNLGDDVDGDPIPRGSGAVTSLQFVRDIVAKGADVNRRLENKTGGKAKLNLGGATPFLMASRTADLPFMKLLYELGADPTITNVDNTTALMAAAGVGVTAVGEEAGTESEVIEAIRWLVDLGIDINAVDENGETAMHGAAYRNYPLAVETLAAFHADPAVWNRKNKHQWTPTLIAMGNRPGSFKPSPETIAALEKAMRSKTLRP